MAKDNKDSVRDYHKQLKDMKIRFLKQDDENGIPDYAAIIKDRAAELKKSSNEYILDLIQSDIQTKDPDFKIVRGMRNVEK